MITEGYLAQHYRGRHGGRDPALLDIIQDYALKVIADADLFEMGLVFKGGTALRKYRAGNLGRFSTDLDFACDEEGMGELVFDVLDGAELFDVRFELEVLTPGLRGRLVTMTPLGTPNIDARLEVVPRTPWLEPDTLPAIEFPVHMGYEFTPVAIPVMSLEESLAEKLAAFRRRALIRDLYDLAWFGRQGAMNERLIRKLTYLKVYVDVVMEGLGDGPFDPREQIFRKSAEDFPAEDIGLLVGNLDVTNWLAIVRDRFEFILNPTSVESRWAACDPRDRYDVSRIVDQLRSTCRPG